MKFSRKATSLPLAALAATLVFGSPRADAQGLFDVLFGGGSHVGPDRLPPRGNSLRGSPPSTAPRVRPRQRAAAPKITGPSYYNYKADSLIRTNFSALASVR